MTQKQIVDLSINPGIYTEQTERGAMGQWYSCDRVRFRQGLAEKIGGWVKLNPQFNGVCRALLDWSSLDSKRWAALGTEKKLYLWQEGNLYDITPIRISGTLSNPFATTNTSATVTVTHTNHGAAVGDAVRFSNASAVGGITIVGEYTIVTVPTSNTYTIVHSSAATADANGGGTVSYEYDISSGATDVVTATGYGSGPYGAEGYGNARTGSTLKLGIRQWSLDTWGEDLLACPRNGSIYWWDRSKGSTARATILSEAPIKNEYMLISQRDRHVLALGAYDYFNQAFDPMLIRWCSTEDLEDWIPTSTNTSGDLRLYNGSKIVTGIRSRLETVIFTDTAVYTLPFIGGFDVFGLNIVGENVSILGPNAAVAIDHRVLFMAESDFYLYDGVVRVVPCSVRNHVYDNMNPDQVDKVYAGLNREFNEVWWFYPSFDPESWLQQDLTLGLPSGYEVASQSTAPEVVIQTTWSEPRAVDNGGIFVLRLLDESANRAILRKSGATGDFSAAIVNGPYSGAFGRFWQGEGTASWRADNIAAYNLGTDDWTFETWVKGAPFAVTNEVSIMNMFGATGYAYAFNLYKDGSNNVFFRFRSIDLSTYYDVELTTWNNSLWHHLVVERVGNTIYVALGSDQASTGVIEGSFAYSGAIPSSSEDMRFFAGGSQTFSTLDTDLDNTALSKGVAKYGLDQGSTYSVPTVALTPVDEDPLFAQVVMLAKFEGTDGATSYTELSSIGAAATFSGNAQIDTAQSYQGASSLLLDGTGDFVSFPDAAAYDFSTNDWTIEGFCRFNTLPPLETSAGPGYCLFSSWGATGPDQQLSVAIIQDSFGYRARMVGVSFAEVNTLNIVPQTGVWYHWAVNRTGGEIRFFWQGQWETSDFGGTPADMGANNSVIRIGSLDGASAFFDGHIDNVRWTMGTARYPLGSYIPVPRFDYAESAGGGAGGIGYSYGFNSAGYTEVAATASSGYEHDYVLINDEPILTPTQAEWAVELDVNPAIGAGTGLAGMCFLRNDITGTPNTGADDANQLMVELDYDGQLVQVVKKINGTIAAPANQGTNTVDFATLTGSAMVTGQRYILTAQFTTPQVTIWVDGIQAFQFNLDVSELAAIGAGGTAGIHMRANASNDNQYRFYNFSTGPVGVLTATDFDISPVEVNRYVAFNYEEGTWTIGKLARTAWADRSPLLDKPYAAGTDGYLYQHETGTDADGAAMGAYIESFDIEIPSAGEHLMHVDQLIPDFLELEGSVDVYLKGRKYPQDINRITKGPYTVSPGTRKLSTRMRARQVAFRIESLQTGAKWRMGTWRGRVGAHGRRG